MSASIEQPTARTLLALSPTTCPGRPRSSSPVLICALRGTAILGLKLATVQGCVHTDEAQEFESWKMLQPAGGSLRTIASFSEDHLNSTVSKPEGQGEERKESREEETQCYDTLGSAIAYFCFFSLLYCETRSQK